MYEMRIEGDEVQVKNGTGSWMSPVVHDGKLYPSQKALADAYDSRGAQVTNAINNGYNFRGKPVRKATESEVRAKLKIEKDEVFAYRVDGDVVEVKGGNGKWTRAVVYKGYFYDNASSINGMSKSRAYARLGKGGDDELRYAERDDIPDGGVEVHAAKKKPKEKKTQKKQSKSAFVGVQWPDGSVEVRLTAGGFTMARGSKKELPSEIVDATTWLA